MVEEACAKVISNIAAKVLSRNPPISTENTEQTMTVSKDEVSGSETDTDEEEHLWADAVVSRKRAVSSSLNTVASLVVSHPADILPALAANSSKN